MAILMLSAKCLRLYNWGEPERAPHLASSPGSLLKNGGGGESLGTRLPHTSVTALCTCVCLFTYLWPYHAGIPSILNEGI